MNMLAPVASYLFGKQYQLTGPSLTFVRLCTSRHLRDLQQITSITILIYLISISVLALKMILQQEIDKELAAFSALTSVAGVVLSWAYQTGSKRIGSVDLFSSEIAVICRVFLIVDFAKRSVSAAISADTKDTITASSETDENRKKSFNSQEQYTPVYDKNVSDLQPFDVDVISSVTRFYTYRKTMVDYLRLITVAPREEVLNFRIRMIYMQYLMYESARDAIVLLVEFEPNQAENLINVLCSEFVLFSLLKQHYEHDFRGRRLELRVSEYNKIMINLRKNIKENEGILSWQRASATYPALEEAYKIMCVSLNLAFMPEM